MFEACPVEFLKKIRVCYCADISNNNSNTFAWMRWVGKCLLYVASLDSYDANVEIIFNLPN
jgi:hypothetical protein